jgi:hypothetical protein
MTMRSHSDFFPYPTIDLPGFAGVQQREQAALDAADGLQVFSSNQQSEDDAPDKTPADDPDTKPTKPTLPDSPNDLPQDPGPPVITDPDPPGDVDW